MVREERLELSRVTPLDPKSSASTNSATLANRCELSNRRRCLVKDLRRNNKINGVNDGTRTHDNRDHNPGLYQLSYAHHDNSFFLSPNYLTSYGTPGRTRTCYPRLRRPMLYPDELRALIYIGRGGEIRTPDILLPKQARYQAALHPEKPSPGQSGE